MYFLVAKTFGASKPILWYFYISSMVGNSLNFVIYLRIWQKQYNKFQITCQIDREQITVPQDTVWCHKNVAIKNI